MQRTKYAAEFKSEAVKQVIDKGHAVADVVKRLGIPEGVLYSWVNKFKKSDAPQSSDQVVSAGRPGRGLQSLRSAHICGQGAGQHRRHCCRGPAARSFQYRVQPEVCGYCSRHPGPDVR